MPAGAPLSMPSSRDGNAVPPSSCAAITWSIEMPTWMSAPPVLRGCAQVRNDDAGARMVTGPSPCARPPSRARPRNTVRRERSGCSGASVLRELRRAAVAVAAATSPGSCRSARTRTGCAPALRTGGPVLAASRRATAGRGRRHRRATSVRRSRARRRITGHGPRIIAASGATPRAFGESACR
jgi:hypothetical protein